MATPVWGTGIMPPSGPVANELTAVTRAGYGTHVYVQIYQSSPFVASSLANAMTMTGGVSPITHVVQGKPMVTLQNIGYDGAFDQPGNTPGLDVATWNPAAYFSAVLFPGMEGLLQVDYSIVPIIEARMNDVTNQYRERFSYDFYQNIANNLAVIGLNGAVDDGTYLSVYGGRDRTVDTWWKSQYVNNSPAVALTRDLTNQYLLQQQKANELPTFGICGLGTFGKLQTDFTSLERYNITPNMDFGKGAMKARMRAVEVSGVPIYGDPRCPEGTLYLLNTNYLTLYVHEKAAFTVMPFESRFPVGQIGFIGGVLTLLQLVCVKPSANMKVLGLSSLSI